MRTTLTSTACIVLAGCGHFLTPLGTSTPLPEKNPTPQQQDADFVECREQSRDSVENPAHYAGAAIAGISVIGAPGTIAYLQAKRKAVFKYCMEQRGYTVQQ